MSNKDKIPNPTTPQDFIDYKRTVAQRHVIFLQNQMNQINKMKVKTPEDLADYNALSIQKTAIETQLKLESSKAVIAKSELTSNKAKIPNTISKSRDFKDLSNDALVKVSNAGKEVRKKIGQKLVKVGTLATLALMGAGNVDVGNALAKGADSQIIPTKVEQVKHVENNDVKSPEAQSNIKKAGLGRINPELLAEMLNKTNSDSGNLGDLLKLKNELKSSGILSNDGTINTKQAKANKLNYFAKYSQASTAPTIGDPAPSSTAKDPKSGDASKPGQSPVESSTQKNPGDKADANTVPTPASTSTTSTGFGATLFPDVIFKTDSQFISPSSDFPSADEALKESWSKSAKGDEANPAEEKISNPMFNLFGIVIISLATWSIKNMEDILERQKNNKKKSRNAAIQSANPFLTPNPTPVAPVTVPTSPENSAPLLELKSIDEVYSSFTSGQHVKQIIEDGCIVTKTKVKIPLKDLSPKNFQKLKDSIVKAANEDQNNRPTDAEIEILLHELTQRQLQQLQQAQNVNQSAVPTPSSPSSNQPESSTTSSVAESRDVIAEANEVLDLFAGHYTRLDIARGSTDNITGKLIQFCDLSEYELEEYIKDILDTSKIQNDELTDDQLQKIRDAIMFVREEQLNEISQAYEEFEQAQAPVAFIHTTPEASQAVEQPTTYELESPQEQQELVFALQKIKFGDVLLSELQSGRTDTGIEFKNLSSDQSKAYLKEIKTMISRNNLAFAEAEDIFKKAKSAFVEIQSQQLNAKNNQSQSVPAFSQSEGSAQMSSSEVEPKSKFEEIDEKFKIRLDEVFSELSGNNDILKKAILDSFISGSLQNNSGTTQIFRGEDSNLRLDNFGNVYGDQLVRTLKRKNLNWEKIVQDIENFFIEKQRMIDEQAQNNQNSTTINQVPIPVNSTIEQTLKAEQIPQRDVALNSATLEALKKFEQVGLAISQDTIDKLRKSESCSVNFLPDIRSQDLAYYLNNNGEVVPGKFFFVKYTVDYLVGVLFVESSNIDGRTVIDISPKFDLNTGKLIRLGTLKQKD